MRIEAGSIVVNSSQNKGRMLYDRYECKAAGGDYK
mgnify:CR=1 FL=1